VTDKATKQAAHYRHGTPDRQCADCSMFRQPNSCTAVTGKIYPDDVCNLFKRAVHYERVQTKHQPKDGLRYERVERKHHLPEGSHRLPSHVVYALGRRRNGKFDAHQAASVVGEVLSPNVSVIDDGTKDVLIPAETVRALGNGDIESGHRVLDRWAEMLREPDRVR